MKNTNPYLNSFNEKRNRILKVLFLSIISSTLNYCSISKDHYQKNKYNDCYEETAKGLECHHIRDYVNYKKLKEEYPRVPSSNSSPRQWLKR